MREVLFKGKHFKTQEWIFGIPYFMPSGAVFILRYANDIKIVKNEVNKTVYDVMFEFDEVIPETICQYIGLTDKNDVKIFENDIVLAGFYKWKCKVVWDNENARFICYTNDKDVKIVYAGMVDKDDKSALEVIGNIFENSELLTG